MAIRIGCGSWSDAEYTGVLYPRGLPPGDRLRLTRKSSTTSRSTPPSMARPKPAAIAQWIAATPPGFLFDIKLHRVFSQSPPRPRRGRRRPSRLHARAARAPDQAQRTGRLSLAPLRPLFARAVIACANSMARSSAFDPHQLAVELRDPAWIKGKSATARFAWFRDAGRGLGCRRYAERRRIYARPRRSHAPGLAYLRLHGRNREGYLTGKTAAEQHDYLYTEPELRRIVKRIGIAGQKRDRTPRRCEQPRRRFRPAHRLAAHGTPRPAIPAPV